MTKVFAHRGWHEDHRENTLAAFRAAVELGVDGIELDVRRTGDGQFVVHHDPHLPDGRELVELRVAELPPWVPTLDQAIEACTGVVVNIEIKNNEGDPDFEPDQVVAREVCRLVAASGLQADVVVSSFNLAAIDHVRATDRAILTAWLVVDGRGDEVATAAARGHAGLNPYFALVDRDLVDRARDAGVVLAPWTVDDPQHLLRLAAWGVDAVITNVPAAALDLLRPAPGP